MKNVEQKYYNNPEKYIPKGLYCYTRRDGKVHLCPFWDKDYSKPEQESGYCHYLKRGDWEEEGFSLLWDQVKECGVNDEEEEQFNE